MSTAVINFFFTDGRLCGRRRCVFNRSTLTRKNCGTVKRAPIGAKLVEQSPLEVRKLGDSDLNVTEITFGTVSEWIMYW